MRCPSCWAPLHPVEMRRYETLLEHVSDLQPSPKMAYGCTSQGCKNEYANHRNIFWDDLGDAYARTGPAVFSWAWRYKKFGWWRKHVVYPYYRLRAKWSKNAA